MNQLEEHRWRIYTLLGLASLWFGILIARLFYIQVLDYEYYREKASGEHWQTETVPARRGDIISADGHPLALTVHYETLYADTKYIEDPESVGLILAKALGEPVGDMQSKLATRQEMPTAIKDILPSEKADVVRSLGLRHIYLRPKAQRIYPEGRLAPQIVGFVGVDNQGLAGLESSLEAQLVGRSGLTITERDTGGSEIPLSPRQYIPPQDGKNAILTIDRHIQRIAEKELEKAIEKHKASGGTVIVMEPKTGALLAIATRPTFDLQKLDLADPVQQKLFKSPSIVDVYEPGSVFKIVTWSAGLESNFMTPNTVYNDRGFLIFGGITVRNWNLAANGTLSIAQALQKSVNVVAAFISTNIGADTFYRYVKAFGFGQLTGIELEGESPGMVRFSGAPDWSPSDLAVNAYGQGIAATPLQVVRAISVIANGGLLMQPYLVGEYQSAGETVRTRPVVVRRVVSEKTTKMMTEMMIKNIEESAVGLAKVPGYKVAGKTGTADIPGPGGYTSELTVASIAGFAPAGDPKIAILVKIDAPKDAPWGEQVAGPVFRSITQQVLNYMGIAPENGIWVADKRAEGGRQP